MAAGEKNSTWEGIVYTIESIIEFIKQSPKGLLIGGIIVILITIYTISNAYKNVSNFLGGVK